MQNNENVTEAKEQGTWDGLAMDIAKRLKAAEKAKDLAIVVLGAAVIAIAISLSVINYRNDCDWRELFSSYDYVSQDGEGQNYYNSEIGGNVSNGTENQASEK